MQCDPRPDRPRVHAVLEQAVSGPADRRHFARVRLSWGASGFRAAEVRPHGSGNLRSMVHANALAVLPEGRGRAEAGETVEVVLLGEPDARE
jgi:molybdopterin molybdotransferase